MKLLRTLEITSTPQAYRPVGTLSQSQTLIKTAVGQNANYFLQLASRSNNGKTTYLISIFHRPGSSYAYDGPLDILEHNSRQNTALCQQLQTECTEALCEETFTDFEQSYRAFVVATERYYLYAPFAR